VRRILVSWLAVFASGCAGEPHPIAQGACSDLGDTAIHIFVQRSSEVQEVVWTSHGMSAPRPASDQPVDAPGNRYVTSPGALRGALPIYVPRPFKGVEFFPPYLRSPDGTKLAIASYPLTSRHGYVPDAISVFDLSSGRQLSTTPVTQSDKAVVWVEALAWSPSSDLLAEMVVTQKPHHDSLKSFISSHPDLRKDIEVRVVDDAGSAHCSALIGRGLVTANPSIVWR